MKVPSVALGLVSAAVFIQTAAGKHFHSKLSGLLEKRLAWYRYQDELRRRRPCDDLPGWLQWPALYRNEALLVSGSFNDFFFQVHVFWTNIWSQIVV